MSEQVNATNNIQVLEDPKNLPKMTKEELLNIYRELRLMRRVEELAAKAYSQKKILGFCHLYIGQESVAVGVGSVTKNDYWITAYREHVHIMVKRSSCARYDGRTFWKGHRFRQRLWWVHDIFDKSCDFMGGWGIVGGHVPLANGVGWAIKHRNEDRVCVCFLVMARCIKAHFSKLFVWHSCTNFLVSSSVKTMAMLWERLWKDNLRSPSYVVVQMVLE